MQTTRAAMATRPMLQRPTAMQMQRRSSRPETRCP